MKNRERYVFLECSSCGNRNYTTYKRPKSAYKVEKQKFCRRCRSHRLHKERKL